MLQMAAMGPVADTVGPRGGVGTGRDQLRTLVQFGQMLQGRLAGF